MISYDPIQHAANHARAKALHEKAVPMYELLQNQPIVREAVDIAKRQRGRRSIQLVLTIDCTDGFSVIPMQCSLTHRPIAKPGRKKDGTSKYIPGKYYIGLGANTNFPGIVSGPFNGAVPAPEGHTLYVMDHKYGLVKVE